MDVRVYLTNLAKYNAGRLVGKWLDLPLTEDELSEAVKEVLGTDEEYFITDYEAGFKIGEYENLSELNRFAEELGKLSEYDQERVMYLINTICLDKEEALRQCDDVTYYPDMTVEDVARELVEEGIFGEIADNIKCYFDYEALARDLAIDGYHETEKGTFWFT